MFFCFPCIFSEIHFVWSFLCCLFNLLFYVVVDRKLVEAHPSNFSAGRPKAALLLWFFDDFRCGALLFMVILLIYKYKNR